MVGAADVTNGVQERRSSSGERGDRRETKVIVSVIETSKRSSLEDLEGWVWQRGKEAHLPMEWLIQERGKACLERKQRRRIKGKEMESCKRKEA